MILRSIMILIFKNKYRLLWKTWINWLSWMRLYRICLKVVTDKALSARPSVNEWFPYMSLCVNCSFGHSYKYFKKNGFFQTDGQNVRNSYSDIRTLVSDVRMVFRTNDRSKRTYSFHCMFTLPPVYMSQNLMK